MIFSGGNSVHVKRVLHVKEDIERRGDGAMAVRYVGQRYVDQANIIDIGVNLWIESSILNHK